MRVRLFSEDAELYRLCREVFAHIPDRQWELQHGDAAGHAPEPDVCIWDVSSRITVPEELTRNGFKHLVIVDRKDLQRVSESLPLTPAGILLKPVTHTALKAFIEMTDAKDDALHRHNGAAHAAADEMLQCLLHANLRLQEYEQHRTNFLARAVHDFRAPLTAIGGYCGLMLNEMLGPVSAEQKDVLARMQHSVTRLSRMAGAMFELSVGRQVRRSLALQKSDLESTLEQVLHETALTTDEKQISVTVDLERPSQPLYLEPAKIEQVLINLIDNACRFTPKGGNIDIHGYQYFWERRCSNIAGQPIGAERRARTDPAPNCYRIDVRDSGPGVAPEYLQTIFEEYTSYSGAGDRSCGGLGLAICKALIEAHLGHVWAESNSDGAVFCFVLPYGQPNTAAAPIAGYAESRYRKAV